MQDRDRLFGFHKDGVTARKLNLGRHRDSGYGMGATLPATHLGAEEDGQVVLRIDDYVGTRDPSPGIAAGLHPQHIAPL